MKIFFSEAAFMELAAMIMPKLPSDELVVHFYHIGHSILRDSFNFIIDDQ
jgi:hypothetical protein